MDSLITAAARALASGDPLGALNRVALRDDAAALALRGIAMAQLGELDRARTLLRSAARTFGPKEDVARARCALAEAEIAIVTRDLGWTAEALAAAGSILEAHGDRANAAYARCLQARRLLLIGRIEEAGEKLALVDPALFPPALRAAYELVLAGIAIRHLDAATARAAATRARDAARHASLPALTAETEATFDALDAPVARLIAGGDERLLLLGEVEELLSSQALVVDACRHVVRDAGAVVPLRTRPVLFALVRALAEAWPQDAPRATLLARAFRARQEDESHRARLRVEIGRLRKELRTLADIEATPRGFVLAPRKPRDVVVLAHPAEQKHAELLALLADGEAWSSSALALALGTSQRSVQRALDRLLEDGKVHSLGRGRARRWLTLPVPGFPTALLLPAPPAAP